MAPATPEKATLLEHLFEIRTRIIRALVAFTAASAVCYLRAGDLFDFLAKPAEGHLVFVHPVDGMMAYIKLALMSGLFISSPYIFYQAFAFAAPALGAGVRRAVPLAALVAYLLFGAGVLFSLKTLPLAMHFLLSYSRPGFEAMISVNEYFSFVFLLTLGTGFAFEVPLLLYFLARVGFISSGLLLRQWRIAVMACLVLGAVLCPTPDVVTWLLVCLPLFGLYLVSIVVVRWVEGRKRAAAPLAP